MGIKRCKASFVTMKNGAPQVHNAGLLVDGSDPIVAAYPDAFEDVEAFVSDRTAAPVEQATAEPGDKRARSAPRKPAGTTKEGGAG